MQGKENEYINKILSTLSLERGAYIQLEDVVIARPQDLILKQSITTIPT